MNYKLLGATDDETTCWNCGKTHLKMTVALEDETGKTVYFGTTCAANVLKKAGVQVKTVQIKTDAKHIMLAQKWLNEDYTIEVIKKAFYNRQGIYITTNGNMMTMQYGGSSEPFAEFPMKQDDASPVVKMLREFFSHS